MTMAIWYKLFSLVKLDCVPPGGISDIMTIFFKGLESIGRDKTLWKIVCLTLIWIWWEKNAKIF